MTHVPRRTDLTSRDPYDVVTDNAGNNLMRVFAASSDITGAVNISYLADTECAVRLNPHGTAAGATGEIRFAELAAGGTDYTGFKAPDALAASVIYTMPDADATSNGKSLVSNASGILSWDQQHYSAVKQADESKTTNTSVQADNNLLFPIAANESWSFRVFLYLTAGSNAPDIQFQMDAPTGNAMKYSWYRFDNQSNPTEVTASGTPQTQALNATVRTVIIEGSVINGSTAGQVAFAWAQNTSNANVTTVQQNSFLEAIKQL